MCKWRKNGFDMSKTIYYYMFSIILWLCCSFVIASPQKLAIQLNINGTIGPATKDYVLRGIKLAEEKQAAVIILQLDTPGGLASSMRDIIKGILNSPIPVITYVSPSGARAASAGTFILYASPIAAMAPGTNLGAASPVSIGGGSPLTPTADPKKSKSKSSQDVSKNKAMNDAVAYIRSLAELRGRNATWAERAVRHAESLSATQALKRNVIDIIAVDMPELLNKANGHKVNVAGQKKILKTKNLMIETVNPDWRSKFLSIITNPNIAYFLILIGLYGLIFEFANPGFVVPGVVGAICLLLALYALQLLPISYVALGLIFLGIAFMIAEAFVPSFGILGFGGIVAFIIGSIMLFDTEQPGYQIAWQMIVAMTIVSTSFFILLITMVIRSRRQRIVTGSEELLGQIAIVKADFANGKGWVFVHGEAWQAITSENLILGQQVRVKKINGLLLEVEKETTQKQEGD